MENMYLFQEKEKGKNIAQLLLMLGKNKTRQLVSNFTLKKGVEPVDHYNPLQIQSEQLPGIDVELMQDQTVNRLAQYESKKHNRWIGV